MNHIEFVRSALTVVALFGPAAFAHHSNSAFNLEEVVAFEGIVSAVDWRNPHVYIAIEREDGTEWLLETDATSVLRRSGWTPDSLELGDSVFVRANPDKDPNKAHALLLSIAGPDGRLLASMNQTKDRAVLDSGVRATSLAGVWHGDEELLMRALLAQVASHPLTAEGAAARNSFRESMIPAADCIAWPTPFVVAANGLYLTEVEFYNENVVFRNEFYNTERIVYMDGRQHPPDGQRTTQGHSIGWWEGPTLVVDTQLFALNRSPFPGTGRGIPGSGEKHVVERYTLSDDGREVQVDIVLTDPEYLAEPLQATLRWMYSAHLEFIGLSCDLESARRFTQ